jgi:hypothetical protein
MHILRYSPGFGKSGKKEEKADNPEYGTKTNTTISLTSISISFSMSIYFMLIIWLLCDNLYTLSYKQTIVPSILLHFSRKSSFPNFLENLNFESSTAIHLAKQKPSGMNKNVEDYMRMRELERLKKSGASYDELKEAILNGTKSANPNDGQGKARSGYQKFVGKGRLDQRLRAIVAYKRSSIAGEALVGDSSSVLSESEEEELYRVMESDEGDDEYEMDDEEAMYETLVMNAIEQAKLSELQKNFMLDKAALRSIESSSINETSPAPAATAENIISSSIACTTASSSSESEASSNTTASSDGEEDDLYTPARSSWGVFKRPRDISKTYGGGRVISREEMQAMDEEFQRQQKESANRARVILNEAMKNEVSNEAKIKDCLSRSRGLMSIGNPKGAVELLESIKDLASYQSDLGSEVWLEYAMALETVDRADDARKVYGQLITSCWNQKARRNALQLLQGLDITAKIKKNLTPAKPVVDYEILISVSKALEKGLTNEWDDYKKHKKRDNLLPWYEDEIMNDDASKLRVTNLEEAYIVLMRVANPLKETSSDLIARAFRMVYTANETERVKFFSCRGILDEILPVAVENMITPKALAPAPAYAGAGSGGGDMVDMRSSYTTNLFASFASDISESKSSSDSRSGSRMSTGRVASSDAYERYVNGSWDLVISLTDKTPYRLKKYDVDSVVRCFDMKQNTCAETVPIFWGISSMTSYSSSRWSPKYCEITLTGESVVDSKAPYQRSRQSEQSFQVSRTLFISSQPT